MVFDFVFEAITRKEITAEKDKDSKEKIKYCRENSAENKTRAFSWLCPDVCPSCEKGAGCP